MFKNFVKTSLRNLTRYKLYSLINIVGLSIGFTVFILIFIFIKYEMSFDQFHEKKDRIVKTNLEFGSGPDDTKPVSTSPTALLPTFKDRFPEVTGGTRYFNPSSFQPSVVKIDGKVIQEKGFAYADSTFFDVFSFKLTQGNEDKVLVEPYSLVITETASDKYFPGQNPLDKELVINNRTYLIKGIMQDVPDNSHIKFNMLASFTSHPASKNMIWGSANYFTYLTLSTSDAIKTLEPKIQPLLQEVEYSQPEQGMYVNVKLEPLEDLYLKSEADALSDSKYLFILSAVALFILVIAAINYMNLATARSVTRAKEVGIRKVTGALRSQLMIQFTSEAVITSMISLVLAGVLVVSGLDLFNRFTGKEIDMQFLTSADLIVPLILVAVFTGIVSGIYPAFLLSSFQPASILKGSFSKSSKGVLLRKILVIFQFSVSIVIIIATLIVGEQLQFIQNKKLGYNSEAVLYIPINRDITERSETFKNEMLSTGYVKSITMGTETPVSIRGGYGLWGEGIPDDQEQFTTAIAADEDFLETFEMKLVTGKDFDKNDVLRTQTDNDEDREYSFILNESAVELLGWEPEQAIGKKIRLSGRNGTLKGVVEDFHFKSLHQEIGPLVIFNETTWGYSYAMIKTKGKLSSAINEIGKKWSNLAPDLPYAYEFIDDNVTQMYQAERSMGQIFIAFATITILVACLGLFGLASFISFQRSKEISIRKVMGASVNNIVYMISKDFIALVLVAFLIAAPIGYFIMEGWLQDFQYRTSIQAWQIIAAFVMTVLIAFLTVSYHALRSASLNPAEVLKNE